MYLWCQVYDIPVYFHKEACRSSYGGLFVFFAYLISLVYIERTIAGGEGAEYNS